MEAANDATMQRLQSGHHSEPLTSLWPEVSYICPKDDAARHTVLPAYPAEHTMAYLRHCSPSGSCRSTRRPPLSATTQFRQPTTHREASRCLPMPSSQCCHAHRPCYWLRSSSRCKGMRPQNNTFQTCAEGCTRKRLPGAAPSDVRIKSLHGRVGFTSANG